jgi:hypothetical protein
MIYIRDIKKIRPHPVENGVLVFAEFKVEVIICD